MYYQISYICLSHTGNVRRINQDNFVCDRQYMPSINRGTPTPLRGVVSSKTAPLFGVFDGMGGGEQGETAAFLAAAAAAETAIGRQPLKDLDGFCQRANQQICAHSADHGIRSMGTTAALLSFTKNGVSLCNIGDSRIYRFRGGQLAQLSQDHVLPWAYGTKPPLSQSLGIPENETILEPHLAREDLRDGDTWLICSDGLTDMLSPEEIQEVLSTAFLDRAAAQLLEQALSRGGKDNITLILCKISRFSWLFR